MDAAEPAHVCLDGFKSTQQEMKLAGRHGVKLRLEFTERGRHFTGGGQACEFPFHTLELNVQGANFRAEILLMRDMLMHRPQVEGDVGRTALIKVGGKHAKGRQTPFQQFQVALHFAFHN